MAVGDHFRVAISGALFLQQIVNVFHYRQSTPNTSTLSDAESLARAVDALFVSTTKRLTNVQTSDVAYGTIEARSFPLPPTPVVGYDLAVTQLGMVDDTTAPPAVAVVVKRKTGFLGRKYRGRLFIAGIPNGAISSGKVTDAGYITDCGDLANAMKASLTWTAGGSPTFVPEICTILKDVGPPVVYSYRATDITSTALDKTVRSQRRREIGRGS